MSSGSGLMVANGNPESRRPRRTVDRSKAAMLYPFAGGDGPMRRGPGLELSLRRIIDHVSSREGIYDMN